MTINAELRTSDFGTRGSRRLLRAGRIPAVVYGKAEPIHVSIDARDFINNKKNYRKDVVTLNIAGENSHNVIVKAVQEDILKNIINHVDFFEVEKN